MSYAEVAVNAPLAQPRTFTYSIPSTLQLEVGHAVWVPFGPRLVQGIVFALSDRSDINETRDIAQVVGHHPILSPHQIALARWISEYYLSSYFDSAALMLPPGFERKVLTMIEPSTNIKQNTIDSLASSQRSILTLLQNKGKTDIKELRKEMKQSEVDSAVTQLYRRGFIKKSYEIESPKIRHRKIPFIKLAITREQVHESIPELERKRAHQQANLVRFLANQQVPVPLPDIKQSLKISATAIKSLMDRGIITREEVVVQRDPLAHRTFTSVTPPQLTPDQSKILSHIRSHMLQANKSAVFLLHGVTGSGKTEIYLRTLEEVVSSGKRAIVLVPEIALTPQTITRFAERFPDRVAVLHSRLSPGEQFDEWYQIKNGAFDVVIGSRSALFAPQPDLGLIIIDEEHEWTYKQNEQAPRYHARDVAIKLADLTNSTVILGSATPDVESYYKTEHDNFRLLQLPMRITTGAGETSIMPHVQIVDLRSELRQGNRSILSRSLASSIHNALSRHEQIILFLNRRGTATFVQCRDCGFVIRCRRCDVTMTYHTVEASLICHQCNCQSVVPKICPNCNSKRIKFLGTGTQKVEEEIAAFFPNARLLRWDRDATKGKHSHEKILERFLAHDADILIGTQMVAKGLDMPLVTLVGVINADLGLHIPNFRASERTFQILTQVAGRAGRGITQGKVVIQSYTPEHYALIAASHHDYKAFYDQEIDFRYQQGNPPFNQLARIVYSHTNATRGLQEAKRIHSLLKQTIDSQGLPNITLIGPSPTFTQRIRGRYRWHIIIRGRDITRLLSAIIFPQGWFIDIDPVNLN